LLQGVIFLLLKRTVSLFLIVLSIVCVFAFSASQNKNVPFLQAEKGRLTVDPGSLASGPYLLTGEWRVYSGLYTPPQLDALAYSLTDDIRYMPKLAGATYALELYAREWDAYCIMMPEPNGCRLWIDGEEVTGGDKERLLDDNIFTLRAGDSDPEKVHLVFQVSTSGGTRWNYQGLVFGTAKQLSKVQEAFLVEAVISMGILLMLLIHALTLFVQKRSERYLLLLAAIALISIIGAFNTTPYIRSNWEILTLSLPDYLRPLFMEFIGIVRIFLRMAILMSLFPGALPKKFNPVFYGGAGFFLVLFALALQSSFLPETLAKINFLILLLPWLYLLPEGWIIVHGFFRKYTGSTVVLIGFCIYVGCRFFLLLISTGIFPHHAIFLPPFQNMRTVLMMYWITIASAINGRFAQKYSQADDLAANLEQKVIEKTAAIQASQDQILLMQQQKKEFTAGIAHNLNSALFTLGGYVEILKDECKIEPPEARQYLSRIDAKVDYVQKMAADMFLMAKLDDGQIRLNRDYFDLAALCRQIMHEASLQTGGKHLTIDLTGAAQPAYFYGDRFYLQQAVENILSNAIRHSNENGRIDISITVADGRYHLAISDQGAGISPKDLPYIFERYFTKKQAGFHTTGLGLSISLEIIRRLGGDITVASTPGEGAVFTIRLPLLGDPQGAETV